MKLSEIEDILERYGLDRILEDNQMTLTEVLDLLVDLGYLELEMYDDAE